MLINKRNKGFCFYGFCFIFFLLILFTFSAISQGVDMFGWFKKQDVFLSSEVNGVVTENGKPIVNLEIIRKLIYTDEKVHRDVVLTDKTGHFSFPQKMTRSSLPNNGFIQNSVVQEISINQKGKLIPLWVASFPGIKELPEYTRKLAFLNCELTNKVVNFEFENNNPKNVMRVASSICRWDEDYFPFRLFDGDKEYIVNNNDLDDLTLQK
jgi:hypothetical protein